MNVYVMCIVIHIVGTKFSQEINSFHRILIYNVLELINSYLFYDFMLSA